MTRLSFCVSEYLVETIHFCIHLCRAKASSALIGLVAILVSPIAIFNYFKFNNLNYHISFLFISLSNRGTYVCVCEMFLFS